MDINKNKIFYEIKLLIDKLKKADYEQEDELINKMDLLHCKLALLLYRYDENFSEEIKKFIKNYDRLDDLETRKILLRKIRNNEYDSLFDI